MRNALVILPLLSHLLVSAQSQAQGRDPWTTTLSMTRKAIAVGECSAVSIDLKDASRQGWPRGPNGAYLSMADFDLSVSGGACGGWEVRRTGILYLPGLLAATIGKPSC